MADADGKTYLWLIKWENPFSQPHRGMLFYSFTLRPDADVEAFEKLIKETAVPGVRGILTRAVRFNPQYLLTEDTERARLDALDSSQVAEVVKQLEAFGTHTPPDRFLVVIGPE